MKILITGGSGFIGAHLADHALRNKNINIHGDGLQTRSISHAIDIASGLRDMLCNFEKTKGII